MTSRPLCVYCRRQPADARWQPFCSERCQLGDLGRWLQGSYRVAGPPADLNDDATVDGLDADAEGDDPH